MAAFGIGLLVGFGIGVGAVVGIGVGREMKGVVFCRWFRRRKLYSCVVNTTLDGCGFDPDGQIFVSNLDVQGRLNLVLVEVVVCSILDGKSLSSSI